MPLIKLLILPLLCLSVACTLTASDVDTLVSEQAITVTPGAILLGNNTPQAPAAAPESTPQDAAPTPTDAAPSLEEGMNPLTGLPLDTTLGNRLPIVAKISNAPPLVRPQAGISAADWVFEHYAEGGLTRFSAIFYGDAPERIGSIRSARLIDYELAAIYDALLIFSGASTGVEELIYGSEEIGIAEARLAEGRELVPPSDFAERAFKGVFFGLPYYFRDEAIEVPHNMFANPRAVWELARQRGLMERAPYLNGLHFATDAPNTESNPANGLDIRYHATRVQWVYDEAARQYKRFSDGQIHADANTGQQVVADNVVILYANHQFTDIVESEWQGSRSYSIEVQLWFEGDAIIARDGRQYAVRWHRPTRESMLTFTYPDGTPFPLKNGKTWVQVVRLPEQQEAVSEWVRIE